MINFLDKLGISGGIDVYIIVSQTSGIEMITADSQGNIKSYAQLPLEYNEAQREIADYDSFKAAIVALFEMRNIDPKRSNVYLSLPTVWFGVKEGLPLMLDDDAINNVIVGELDQTYIFKQKEATPFWFDSLAGKDPNARTIFYTALQSDAIETIKNIFTKMGANLVSITCSLVSDLEGLYYSGISTELMNNDNSYWSLMVINSSGFQMIEMVGRKILKFYEEPMALKAYEGEEVYNALESALQIALMDSPSSALVVVSETDLVSAELLHNKLGFGGTSYFVEDNAFKKEPLVKLSLNVVPQDQLKVSLAALSASAPENLLPMSINFLIASGYKVSKNDTIEIPLGKASIKLTPIKATIVALGVLILVLGPILLTERASSFYLSKVSNENQELEQTSNSLQTEIDNLANAGTQSEFDPFKEIEKVLKNNRAKIMAYSAIGDSIPRNIYLTNFTARENGLIRIQGCADSVEEVYVFFKTLKDSLYESKLRLSKLDLKAGSLDSVVNNTEAPIDDAPYVFEITNMDSSQLNSLVNSIMPGNSGDNSQGNNIPAQPTN